MRSFERAKQRACRPDPGDRPRLRSPGMRRSADDRQFRPLANVQRQPNRGPAGRLRAGAAQEGRSPLGEHYIVKTLVTSEMLRRIADSYGVRTFGDLLVGFKWIGGVMDEQGPDQFLFGAEESHGYLVGQYARDKDGAVACMLMAELAAAVKAQGLSLHEKLEALFWQHGYHAEGLLNQQMPGSEGMARMQALMGKFRSDPPQSLGGIPVTTIRDYQQLTRTVIGSAPQPLSGPQGDLIFFDLAETGNYVAVRPSGTEPKVKFYMFTYVPPEKLADMELARHQMEERLHDFQRDLSAFVEKA